MQISFHPNPQLKPKPTDESKLGFGRVFTDYMFTMRYSVEDGWHDAKIEPYGPVGFDLASMVFHYGQSIFEGMKAYRLTDGSIQTFRARDNFVRMNNSATRLCMPHVDVDFCMQALNQLLTVEKDWVPSSAGTSLYIRPVMFATDNFLGVHASHTYLFAIILCPVGAYYAAGLKPVKIYVENEYVRAVKGGMGFAKTAGNYASSLLAGLEAEQKGFSQVLWLDGKERKYIEEVGAMNIMFVIDDKIITPALQGSILPGITRDSVLKLAAQMGMPVEERAIAIQEIFDMHATGRLQEVFGTGTAAVISPVSHLVWGEKSIEIHGGQMGPVATRMYDTLTGIQTGRVEDPFSWTKKI